MINPILNKKLSAISPGKEQQRPFLKYIGDKSKIAKILLPHIPEHRTYVEPFMGSGAFFFAKERSRFDILNDLDGDLINLMVTIRDNPGHIINWVWHTPFSQTIHKEISGKFADKKIWNSLSREERACNYFYLVQLMFNQTHRLIQYFEPKFQGHKWKQEAIVERMWLCSAKLLNTTVLSVDYQDLIYSKVNTEKTFYFLDPPYTVANRIKYYSNNFGPYDHEMFKLNVQQIKGKFMITYDKHEYVKNLFKDYYQYDIPGFDKELLITNFKIGEEK